MTAQGSTSAETEADFERSPYANQRMRLPMAEQVLRADVPDILLERPGNLESDDCNKQSGRQKDSADAA